MSTEAAKSIGAAIVFSGVAWLSDIISGGLGQLQIAFAALYTGPQGLLSGIITGLAAALIGAIDFVAQTDLLATTIGGLTVFLSMQMFVSLLTLCVFYAVARTAPKGTYTQSDHLIAAGVFLLESVPFVSTFVFWGSFAVYLRRKEVSRVVEKVSQASGLNVPGGNSKSGIGALVRRAASALGK